MYHSLTHQAHNIEKLVIHLTQSSSENFIKINRMPLFSHFFLKIMSLRYGSGSAIVLMSGLSKIKPTTRGKYHLHSSSKHGLLLVRRTTFLTRSKLLCGEIICTECMIYCEIIIISGVIIFVVHLNSNKIQFSIDCCLYCLKLQIQEPMDQCIL